MTKMYPARRSSTLGPFLLLAVLAAGFPLHAQVTVDSNPHYLDFQGAVTPLIGMSGEYLPHVTRPGKSGSLCTWETYLSCLNNLAANGLNKTQVWLSVDSSAGQLDCNTVNAHNPGATMAVPYDFEQPFFWNGGTWRLDRYEPTFWSRLNQVIADAAAPSRNIVVEVTLFAPGGNTGLQSSPWNPSHNIVRNPGPGCGGSAGFTSDKYLTSFDNNTLTGSDSQVANQCARAQQLALVTYAAQQLNANTNFYWQLANEPDTTSDPVALINWYNKIAQTIAAVEGTSTYPNTHRMAIDVTNFNVMDHVSQNNPALDSHINIVNGHYVDTALPLLKTYFFNKPFAFGFNEGRSTVCPTLVGSRAESWEFMMNEAATYDNYNLNWSDNNTASIQGWLKNLKSFLSPLSLSTMSGPQTGPTLGWASGLPSQGTPDGTGTNFYWAAMREVRNQYILYMHHSTIPTNCVSKDFRYAPPATCPVPGAPNGFQSSMSLSLGSVAGHFKADWVFPSSGAVACSQDLNWVPNSPIPVTSPRYRYDLALRITRCSGSGACAPVTDCSVTAADGCPPADPLQGGSCTCPASPPPSCPTPHQPSSCPYGNPPCQ
ncbi:MAG TPA: hypothetical protein VHQ90_15980 [Thermoanaerobaculia bacterium]|nr:hypothetical protein [Thermoanaerobaculia bacterium]